MEIDVETLSRLRDGPEPLAILDVREPWETDICAIDGSVRIPLGSLPGRVDELPRDRLLVVMCHHGGRSAAATALLRRQGFEQAVNLAGGIDAWARRIDSSMETY